MVNINRGKNFSNSAYAQSFLQKRNNILNIKPSNKKVTPTQSKQVLSVQNLNNLTPIEDGKDMAQIDTETYVNNLIVYYMADDLRTGVLGKQNKPTIPQGVIDISASASSFYNLVSVPWLALGVAQNNTDFIVNKEILNGDLTLFFQKIEYVNQVNLIYAFAFVDRVPDIKDYIEDTSTNWADEYYNYLLQNFIPTYPSLVVAQPQSVIDLLTKPIMSKLDLLDPNGDYSSKFRYQLAYSLVVNQIQENMSVVAAQPAFEKSIEQAINDLLKSGETNATITQLRSIITVAGSASTLASQLSAASASLAAWAFPNPAAAGAALAAYPGFAPSLRALANDPTTGLMVKNIFGALALTATAISIGWAYANWANSTTQVRTKTIFSTVQLFFTISNLSEHSGNFFTALIVNGAEWTIDFLYRNNLVNLAFRGYIEQIFETLFTDKWSTFVQKRVTPIFLLANIGMSIYDIYQDIVNKNYGAIPFDVIALLATSGQFALLFVNTSWSGPVGAVLAIIAAVALLIKIYVFPTPSAIDKFHKSLPGRYTDTTLKIGVPTTALTKRTMISQSGTNKYINPDSSSSTKLTVNATIPYSNQIKLSSVTNGYLTIKVPLNSLPAPSVASFLSSRTNEFLYSGGPAIETETFILIATSDENSFHLLSWNSQFLFVRDNGDLVLSDNNKSKFTFTNEVDWFLPTNFNLTSKINVGQYYGNSTYVIAVFTNGVYVIDITKSANATSNLSKYITDHPDSIVYTVFNLNGDKIPNDAKLRLNENGTLLIKLKNQTKFTSTLVQGKNITFSQDKTLILPEVLNSGFYLQVVDEDYQIFSHNP